MSESDTGAAYATKIVARPSDRRVRAAFQALALTVANRDAAIFDFGAGPGIDARFFAGQGFALEAYDVDPGMREFFASHCADFIKTGQITLHGGDYNAFLGLTRPAATRGIGLVTANFAPLNLVSDLPQLFAKFHALTRPDSRVLAAVLNPYFVGDLKYRWWWSNALRLWRDGCYPVHGAGGAIFRRRRANFAAQSRPYFALERVIHGMPHHKFTFLLFRKLPARPDN